MKTYHINQKTVKTDTVKVKVDGVELEAEFYLHEGEIGNWEHPGMPDEVTLKSVWAGRTDILAILSEDQVESAISAICEALECYEL